MIVVVRLVLLHLL